MIIEEVWNAILAGIICFIYPFTVIAGIFYEFFDTIYQTVYSSIDIVFTAMEALMDILTLVLALIVPAPIFLGYLVLLAIMIFAFLKRRIGEISIAGFKWGG